MKIKWNSEQIPKMNVKNNKDVSHFLHIPHMKKELACSWIQHPALAE